MHRAAFLLLAGCEAILHLEHLDPPAVDAPSQCARGSPFESEELVAIGGSHSVEAVRFNAPRTLALIALAPFGSPPDPNMTDIYIAMVDANHVIGGFSKMAGVSSSGYDSYPTFTPDGTSIVLSSHRGGAHDTIWIASEANGGFDNPTFVAANLTGVTATNYNEPYTLAEGNVMYFEADSDIYRAEGDGVSATPATSLALDTPNRENTPVVTDDELEIFFASDRDAPGAITALEIYAATHDVASDDFGPATVVAQISTPAQTDYPVWLSPDACDLYYVTKPAGVGELHVAHR